MAWSNTYSYRVLVSLDQLANALRGGWSDETLSSRTYREATQQHAKHRWIITYRVINFLFC